MVEKIMPYQERGRKGAAFPEGRGFLPVLKQSI